MLPRRLLAVLLLPLLPLQGCTMVFRLFVRNLSAEPLTLRLYPKKPEQFTPGYLPMAPQVLKPRYRNLRLLTDSVALQRQGPALVVTMPPHSTATFDGNWIAIPNLDSVRVERPGHPAQVFDEQTLAGPYDSRLGPGGGTVWLDFP
ncbi:hypothetical protein EJV47_02070 [Hymenobacter gummosus]|uniref:Uncharacterized protein n=1 Tax=Hymenobacter gummosus TaxID=1776032 RepID=A0A3S0K8W2_9BACT|nr:hypothetical protein [Hymenobacter gummosus]RTQ53549.1 hypothetical protein EJV47_02070 [Hymenobacter gummosus]